MKERQNEFVYQRGTEYNEILGIIDFILRKIEEKTSTGEMEVSPVL